MYTPPFTITSRMLSLVAEISQMVGHVVALQDIPAIPHLRKQNRIRTIHSSLAIENNTLTLEQVTDVINGKRVLGRTEEIKEVQNAYQAYDVIMEYNAYSIQDLLKAHGLMMHDLVKESGRFRSSGVGVFGEKGLVHLAPPAHLVPKHIKNLFDWYKQSDVHVLVKSAVFYYEFEFIHPFADGNGRMGRMWHSKLLAQWNPIFYWLPVEDLIRKHQQEYYDALNVSDNNADSTRFVEFMLSLIKEALEDVILKQTESNQESNQEKIRKSNLKFLSIIRENPKITIDGLAKVSGLSVSGVKKRLDMLKNDGSLRRVGSTKGGYWEVVK